MRVVLEQEDTDGDFQISVTDAGPKLMALGTATSNGFKTFDIRVRGFSNAVNRFGSS
jgi:alpha,alpha-trehalase